MIYDINHLTICKKISKRQLLDNGFRHYGDRYLLSKPVYFNQMKPLIFFKMIIEYDEEDNMPFALAQVVNENGDLYVHYYNRAYGKNDVVPVIEDAVNKILNNLYSNGVIKRVGKERKMK